MKARSKAGKHHDQKNNTKITVAVTATTIVY